MVLAGPSVHYHGEVREWDLAGLVDNYQQYTSGGFEAPVIAEHDPAVTCGKRLGDLVEIREHDGGLVGLVRWALSDAEDLIETGQIRYTSPGIGQIEMHDTGAVLETVYEISVVTSPHQRGATTHVLAKGVAMTDEEPQAEVEPLEEEEGEEMITVDSRIAALEVIVERLATVVGAAAAEEAPEGDDAEGDEAEGDEEPVEDLAAAALVAENAQLRAQNADYARRVAFAEFSEAVKLGSTFVVTTDNLEALFLLKQTCEDAFNSIAVTARKPATLSSASSGVAWGVRLGSSEATDPSSEPSNAVELKALCLAEVGGDNKKANKLFLERAQHLGIV
jgi:hypothetical protein